MSWDSMNGRFRSHSCGGSGPQSGLLLSRTPVYIIVGVPSESAMQHPGHMRAALCQQHLGCRVRGSTPNKMALPLRQLLLYQQATERCEAELSESLTREAPVRIEPARCRHKSWREVLPVHQI